MLIRAFAMSLFAMIVAAPLAAQTGEDTATPTLKRTERDSYETRILRLAEILGGLHLVRPLCHPEEEDRWRERMMELIRLEKPSDNQKTTMIERFNRGYEAAGTKFSACTPEAQAYAGSLAQEGGDLSRQLSASIDSVPQ